MDAFCDASSGTFDVEGTGETGVRILAWDVLNLTVDIDGTVRPGHAIQVEV